jgi:hypothetical protein
MSVQCVLGKTGKIGHASPLAARNMGSECNMGTGYFLGMFAISVALLASITGRTTFNPIGFLAPLFVDREDHPKLYWFGIFYLSAFFAFGLGAGVAHWLGLIE